MFYISNSSVFNLKNLCLIHTDIGIHSAGFLFVMNCTINLDTVIFTQNASSIKIFNCYINGSGNCTFTNSSVFDVSTDNNFVCFFCFFFLFYFFRLFYGLVRIMIILVNSMY
jgi:hypothetical protein